MGRDARIEARLERWAQWVTVGDGSGYPTTNTLHKNWSPPGGGVRSDMKVARPGDARETHEAIRQLSVRLANTLVVHYCMRLPLAEQAARLDCAVSTVESRVVEAHGQLLALLASDRHVHPVDCNKVILS